MKLETFAFLALVGGIFAAAWYVFRPGGTFGAGAPDPGGGAPATSVLGAVVNQLEIGSSSLSEEGAIAETFSHPLTTIETILGFNQGGDSSSDSNGVDGSYSGDMP